MELINWDKIMDIGGLIVPFLTVLISFILGSYTAKNNLKESKSLEDELGLSEISKELLIKTSPLSFYKEKLPSFEKFQKNKLDHLYPNS
ncbi:hypothetical protein K4Q45_05460 [Staphylococcus epidermidis]|nr:hypothetical protein [Staphylococcus epidermidis]MCG1740669.1 hypothetical protein [Staphylococcus epidermidis]